MLSKARFYVTKKSLLLFVVFFFQCIHISHIATQYRVLHILQTLSLDSTCYRKELFKQSVLQITGLPVNPNKYINKQINKQTNKKQKKHFSKTWVPLSFQILFQTESQGLFYWICRVISSSYLQNKHKKIYNLIPGTEILELFTSLNNQIKQHKNLQSYFT